jgi:ATP-dependent DNA helicase RecQ
LETAKLTKLVEAIAAHGGPVARQQFVGVVELSDRKLTTALHRLADVGAVEILPGGAVQLIETGDLHEAAEKAAQAQDHHKETRREKLRQMQEYADSSACRRQMLLRYFGDDFDGPCNNCDNCAAATAGTRREVA